MSDQYTNPDQAAVDAELARFNDEWDAKHPRQMVDMDRKPGDPIAPASMNEFRANLRARKWARESFIRTNPVIQEALRREVQGKAGAIRARELPKLSLLAGLVNRLKRRRAC